MSINSPMNYPKLLKPKLLMPLLHMTALSHPRLCFIGSKSLYVPSMKHTVVPSFLMCKAGLVVNDVPRIHCGDSLQKNSHCILANEP